MIKKKKKPPKATYFLVCLNEIKKKKIAIKKS